VRRVHNTVKNQVGDHHNQSSVYGTDERALLGLVAVVEKVYETKSIDHEPNNSAQRLFRVEALPQPQEESSEKVLGVLHTRPVSVDVHFEKRRVVHMGQADNVTSIIKRQDLFGLSGFSEHP
jgi:hypothetical protein